MVLKEDGSGTGQPLLGAPSLQRISIKEGQLLNGHCRVMLVKVRAFLVQSSQSLPQPASVPWFP